jgi:hypothetical protein
MAPLLSAAVEGLIDEAVVARLATRAGFDLAAVYGRRGRPHLIGRLHSYNEAARHYPWLVIADLDHDVCAPRVLEQWLPAPAELMRCRVAVREIESWLLGDADRLAKFLSVPLSAVPADPETVDDPKQAMVNLARRSRNSSIRRRMVPPIGARGTTGPGYTATMIEFVSGATSRWRPDVAARRVDSLARALAALKDLYLTVQT